MKAIILARVSSEEQRNNDSIPAQTRRLKEYCEHKQLVILDVYQLVESSTKANRKKFNQVLQRIRQSREPIALITDTVDRLQRSFRESVELEELRKKGKIELHFLRENLIINKDSNSADRLRWDLAVMFAKSYVAQLSDNVKRSQEERRRRGEWCTQAPFGYSNVRRNNRPWVEPNENAIVVQEIFNLYATGNYSVLEIKEWISDVYSLKMPRCQIHFILNNPFYYGQMLSKGKLYPHIYKTLISKDLYDTCQKILHGRSTRPQATGHKYGAIPYAYRGLIKCGICGCAITPERSKGYHYYHCTQSRGKHENAVWVREENLTSQFVDILGLIQPSEQQFGEIMKLLDEYYTNSSKNAKSMRSSLEGRIKINNAKSQKLLDLFLEDGINKSDYDIKKKELDEQNVVLESRLSSIDEKSANWYKDAKYVFELFRSAPRLFSESSEIDKKQLILKILFRNLTLTNGKLGWKLKNPFAKMDFSTGCLKWLPRPDSNWQP